MSTTSRSVPEWIGASPDAKVPPRVRLRIFNAHNGHCHLSGRVILPGDTWDLDHKVALANGGEHRESNLAPALSEPHKKKTAQDVDLKAKLDRIRKRHIGIKKPRTMTRWRKFDRTIVYATRER